LRSSRSLTRHMRRGKGFRFGLWKRLVNTEIPCAVREALTGHMRRGKGCPGLGFWGGIGSQGDPLRSSTSFSRAYEERKRLSGFGLLGGLVVREIPCAVRQAFTRHMRRGKVVRVWAFRRIFYPSDPYFAPVIICLVVGIFLGKEHIKIISGKTVSHLIFAQRDGPIIERESRNSPGILGPRLWKK